MQYKLNNKFALLAGVVALAATASAQTNPPSWWGTNDGFTTSQSFGFDTDVTPFAPEFEVNPFGDSSGFVSGGDPVWLDTFMGRDGVWSLDDDHGSNPDDDPPHDELTLDIPNFQNPGYQKNWWFQAILKYDQNSTPWLRVSPNNAYLTNNIRVLDDGWFEWTVTGVIIPQPSIEWVELWVDPGQVYYDTVYFGTNCVPVPEPATMAALGIGAVALIRRRKRK